MSDNENLYENNESCAPANEGNRSKPAAAAVVIVMTAFYAALIFYILVYVVKIGDHKGFAAAVIFEVIGIAVLLMALLWKRLICPGLRIGFNVSLIIAAVVYNAVLCLLNIFALPAMSQSYFIMLQLMLLFVFCLFSLPVILMGNK